MSTFRSTVPLLVKGFVLVFVALAVSLISIVGLANQPDASLTPGVVCSPQDPNFSGNEYPEQVAICKRNVSVAEKMRVSEAYGVPQQNWRFYEFDHLIPLCAGGSDDAGNIWPEKLDHAHLKDRIEDQVCAGMRAGTLSQRDAITAIFDWLRQNPFEDDDAIEGAFRPQNVYTKDVLVRRPSDFFHIIRNY